VNQINEPSITSAPQSRLITLESLRAVANAFGLSEGRYQRRVSIVPADLVRASVLNDGVCSQVNDQDVERAMGGETSRNSGDTHPNNLYA
jgi:hypothetical protein